MEPVIYTMVQDADWQAAQADGLYRGSADDRRDGFLHFSTAAQMRASAARHRAGQHGLWLLAADTALLGEALKWEPAAGGSRRGLFPHLYAPLPVASLRAAVPLPVGTDGLHVFPAEIP